MIIEFPDEYYEFRDVFRKMLEQSMTPAHLRGFWEGEAEDPLQVWRQMCSSGFPDMLVSSQIGGDTLPSVGLALLLEEAGRYGVPHPIADTMMVALPLFAKHLSDPVIGELMRRICTGEAMATTQWGVDGSAPWAKIAGLILVIEDEEILVYASSDCSIDEQSSVDKSRWLGHVQGGTVIARLPADNTLRCRAVVAHSILLNGVAQGVLDMTIEYAKMRVQFGRPIGSFQAVKHRIALAFAHVENVRRYAWLAAWSLENDSARSWEMAARAKALAGDAAIEASYAALQVHGAVGYTWECDLNLWMKRIQVLDGVHGSSHEHWQWLARSASDVSSPVTA